MGNVQALSRRRRGQEIMIWHVNTQHTTAMYLDLKLNEGV